MEDETEAGGGAALAERRTGDGMLSAGGDGLTRPVSREGEGLSCAQMIRSMLVVWLQKSAQ